VFDKLGIKNIETRVGDGSKGWEEFGPYEAIIITAAAREVPGALIDQLAEGGCLVAPVGSGPWQRLIRIKKEKGKLKREDFGGCAFVPLIEEK
jgi:protein-L-isoaspartate(D-aspartate) O-methyltransferase